MENFNHDFIYTKEDSEFFPFAQNEDFQSNLSDFLKNNFLWENKSVLELGVGFGRITDIYVDEIKSLIATDKSEAMINFCINKYCSTKSNVNFMCCEHEKIVERLPSGHFNVMISSYSLCYTATKYKTKEALFGFLDKLFSIDCDNYIIIENSGIFSLEDEYLRPYQLYFEYLNSKFKSCKIRTDFKFNTNEEAVKHSRIFFGNEISEKIKKSGNCIVPETTCIWYKHTK